MDDKDIFNTLSSVSRLTKEEKSSFSISLIHSDFDLSSLKLRTWGAVFQYLANAAQHEDGYYDISKCPEFRKLYASFRTPDSVISSTKEKAENIVSNLFNDSEFSPFFLVSSLTSRDLTPEKQEECMKKIVQASKKQIFPDHPITLNFYEKKSFICGFITPDNPNEININLHDCNLRGYVNDVTATIPHELIHTAQHKISARYAHADVTDRRQTPTDTQVYAAILALNIKLYAHPIEANDTRIASSPHKNQPLEAEARIMEERYTALMKEARQTLLQNFAIKQHNDPYR
jgi:hypothetical protein